MTLNFPNIHKQENNLFAVQIMINNLVTHFFNTAITELVLISSRPNQFSLDENSTDDRKLKTVNIIRDKINAYNQNVHKAAAASLPHLWFKLSFLYRTSYPKQFFADISFSAGL